MQSIIYTWPKSSDSGYKQAEIDTAKYKALKLDRKELLGTPKPSEELPSQSSSQLRLL